MQTSDFDYDLPPGLIAQQPAERREEARLLVLDRASGETLHRTVADLPGLLGAGDLLVVNDTRVLPARVHGTRSTGGRVEVLFVEPRAGGAWEALVRAGGRLLPGERIDVDAGALELGERVGGGTWTVAAVGETTEALMERAGRMPLPPYIRRDRDDARDAMDRERYQTVFAAEPGAIAAPTAGLHLTDALLDAARSRGVTVAEVTLHVGIGTFQPVRTEDLDEHEMHTERYSIPSATAAAIASTREAGGRIVVVGTTSVRALEAAAAASSDGLPQPGRGVTDLFIRPGHRFRVVDALLTNFHLPRSTLLCLVSALTGRERLFAAYDEAIRSDYRFYSYGDAMLVV